MKTKISVKKLLKEYEHVEEEYFRIDKEKRVAFVELRFNRPSDVFERNCVTEKAVFSDEFFEWISYAFEAIPEKYKVDLTVFFDDTEGYTEEQLKKAFVDNVILELKISETKARKRSVIAYGLIALGVALFSAMVVIGRLWNDGTVWRDIAFYVMDIATTVAFWEAMTMLLVDRAEERGVRRDFALRFSAIRFLKSGQNESEKVNSVNK